MQRPETAAFARRVEPDTVGVLDRDLDPGEPMRSFRWVRSIVLVLAGVLCSGVRAIALAANPADAAIDERDRAALASIEALRLQRAARGAAADRERAPRAS
jgi:hypothetical protein